MKIKVKKPEISKETKLGHPKSHVKVPLDSKNLLKMHISHAIMQNLLKIK